MDLMELLNWILAVLTLIAGGGWFVNWRAYRRSEDAKASQEEANAKEQEANAFKAMQDTYQQTLADVNKTLAEVRAERDMTLNEVRAERDHYKEERNELRKDNHEMRVRQDELESKVARLGRRLDCLSPFLCGRAGCMNRTKVSLMEDIDDNSFSTIEERDNQGKTE